MTGDGQVSEWVLEIHRPGKEPVIVQAKDGLTMGRHPDNDVVIEDARASAHHAEIRAQGDSFVLVDLGSTNKTKLGDGKPLGKGEAIPLSPGLVACIGKTTIEFKYTGDLRAAGEMTIPAVEARTPEPGEPEKQREPDERRRPVEPRTTSGIRMIGEGRIVRIPAAAAEEVAATREDEDEAGAGASPAVPPAPSVEEDNGFDESTTAKGAGSADTLLHWAEWRAAGPRLIVASESIRQRINFPGPELLIGRSQDRTKGITCCLPHDGVSLMHARIRFAEGRFFLEDLGSKNGTYIDAELLQPEQPREVQSDQRVRFGPVEALFITDDQEGGLQNRKQHYMEAGRVLMDEQIVTKLAMKKAVGDALGQSNHLGEALLLGRRISCRQWCDALDKAVVLAIVRKEVAQRVAGIRWLLVVVILFCLALLVLLITSSFF